MGMVAVDSLAAGMVLARPVISPQGQLLAPAGTHLTERHLRLFHMWGVGEADIDGWADDQPLEATALSDAEQRLIQATIEQRFEGVLGHPVMLHIARVAIQLTLLREAARG